MGKPAARVGDHHTCPMVEPGPKPHVGGPILPPGCPTVLICNKPAARINDKAFCIGPVDTIVKGAFPVTIGNMPASRESDATSHGGKIVIGCSSVEIGLAGTTGNPLDATKACRDASNGRPSGSTQQSYQNCGVESSRQIINRANNSNISERNLLNQSMNNNWANRALTIADSGGTSAASRTAILSSHGVSSTTQAASMQNLGIALSQGRGVICSVMAGTLWAPSALPPGTGRHAILVTGIEYNSAGDPTHVIINDTGTGNCGQRVPAATFTQAMSDHGGPLNITNDSLWW